MGWKWVETLPQPPRQKWPSSTASSESQAEESCPSAENQSMVSSGMVPLVWFSSWASWQPSRVPSGFQCTQRRHKRPLISVSCRSLPAAKAPFSWQRTVDTS